MFFSSFLPKKFGYIYIYIYLSPIMKKAIHEAVRVGQILKDYGKGNHANL